MRNISTRLQGLNSNKNESYLADNIIFLCYLEVQGHLKRGIGALKERLSDFSKTIRDFIITSDGIKVGDKLENMLAILSGIFKLKN